MVRADVVLATGSTPGKSAGDGEHSPGVPDPWLVVSEAGLIEVHQEFARWSR